MSASLPNRDQLAAIVFGFDDTLIDSKSAYDDSLAAVGLKNHHSAYLDARALVHERLGPHNTQRNSRLLYFKAMMPHLGPASLLDLHLRYEAHLEKHLCAQWEHLGRRRLMEKLRRRFLLGVVTNENTRTQLLKWRACDPDGRLFQAFVTSEEMGHQKPEPCLFQAVTKSLKIPIGACLMVGDSLTCDVQPAQNVGMRAILTREFTQKLPSNLIPNCPQIAHLDDLEEMLLNG